VVVAHEVAPRPAQDAEPEIAQKAEYVATKAVGVAESRALLKDPSVNAAAEMLDEPSEDVAIEDAKLATGIYCETGHD
jgi:hypothetical protein